MPMRTNILRLDRGWRFCERRPAGAPPDTALPWLPAKVPGHVHLDLVNAGVIDDPFSRLAERGVQWVDETDWVYENTFQLDSPPAPDTLLRFHGLDTVAEITLNGTELGRVDNIFVPHDFAVGSLLTWGDAGPNVLRATFQAARAVGQARLEAYQAEADPDSRFVADGRRWSPRSFVRKAQFMYGWDWGPELASCGIWRPVDLIFAPVARLGDWNHRILFHDCHTVTVNFDLTVHRSAGAESTPLSITLSFPRAGNEEDALDVPLPAPVCVPVPAGSGLITVGASVLFEDAQRWWPNRHNPDGAGIHPTLYTAVMQVESVPDLSNSSDTPTILDHRTARIGLRTVELIREPDSDGAGESFKFRVNGVDLFARGANWIPADSFPSRLENESGRLDGGEFDPSPALPASGEGVAEFSDDRVYNLLWHACDAGLNMLRVWGGGLYESEHFYELCDEHGILVWQDFPYACAYYPDDAHYAEAGRIEATAAVRRLRNHPSLALWCGNNENDWMYQAHWGGSVPGRFLGERLYQNILPNVVAEEDPDTPYVQTSPFGGLNPNSANAGDRHNWDVWHGDGDWPGYALDNGRFISEFGFASSCSLDAWDTCLADDERTPHSPAVRWHEKTRKGYDKYLHLVERHYPPTETLEDLVYYTQLNQADALKFGVEHYRRLKGRCWGTLFWQWNDCWPVQSWSVIDSAGQPKAAYYASRRFYAPVLISLVRNGSTVEVHVTNDALGPVEGMAKVALKAFDGTVLTEAALDAPVAVNSTSVIGALDITAAIGLEAGSYVTATLTGPDGDVIGENLLLLTEPKLLHLDPPDISVDVGEEDEDTLSIALRSDAFAASVWLRVDGESLDFSDNFFHLQPGRTYTVTVAKAAGIESVEDLEAMLRVRTLAGEE
ncbi:MAG: beta-mannosidase [Capsulimonadaceae bacterium]